MDDEHEPDYRFTLANERTFLAWVRTSLALLAGAVAVVQLVPEFGFPGARRWVGAVLAVMGLMVSAGGVRRWQRVQQAMRAGEDLPPTRMPLLLAATLCVLMVLVLALLLTVRR